MSFRYLTIDLNSFFSAVEQQLRPELRGLPIAVVPTLAETTCCIAASYEAKRFGVKTGTKVYAARKLCPEIRIVEARPPLYIEFHHRIVEAVDSCLPVEAVLSIDEMTCRLVGKEQQPKEAVRIAREIKTKILSDVGECLTCSVGIAPNAMLAKLATDMQKPDGLVVIRSDELPERLYGLELTDFPGIGLRMERRLHRHGVKTVKQLCQLSANQLAQIWGSKVLGTTWWHLLRGDDVPRAETRRRSVGHSHVLPPKLRNDTVARTVVMRLLHKAAARLRHIGYWAGSVTLSVTFLGDRDSWHERQRVSLCQDTLSLIQAIGPLWKRKPRGTPLKVGVVLGDLVSNGDVTQLLFEQDRKRVALATAMDRVNEQFGANAVYFAGMHGAKERAATRIAFTQIPDLDLPDA